MSLHPDNGARFELRRLAMTEGGASYAVVVRLPEDVTATYTLAVGAETAPEVTPTAVTPDGAHAPAWVEQHVRTLGKQLAKSATYPRLFQRWRDAPAAR